MFDTARADVADALEAAGVTVTTDPTGLLPMVFVGIPESIVPAGNAMAAWTAVIPVWIVAPPPGGPEALDWLLLQLPPVLNTLKRSTADAESFPLNGKECPAYRVDVNVSVPNELC